MFIARFVKERCSSIKLILLLFFIFIGCNYSSNKNASGIGKIKVADFRGDTVVLEKPAERIVCLIESALSGFYMLGAENSIVGVSSNVYEDNVATQYAALDIRIKNKSIPAPGNWDFVNIESVIALNPDLVIMWASQTESIEALESKGIPVYAVMLKNIEDVYKEITDLGKLTGKESRADSLITYTKEEVKKIQNIADNAITKKKVYFMWAQGPLETSGTNSTVNELIKIAGATNVCNSEDEHIIVNLEKVIEWDPEIIVMWYNTTKGKDDILQLSGWNGIKAIKIKNVHELPSVFYCDLWTLKFPYAARLLSSWCYPELFDSTYLDQAKKEMLIQLYGKKGEMIP